MVYVVVEELILGMLAGKHSNAGTGELSMPMYETLQDADITCRDYSADWIFMSVLMKCTKEKWEVICI